MKDENGIEVDRIPSVEDEWHKFIEAYKKAQNEGIEYSWVVIKNRRGNDFSNDYTLTWDYETIREGRILYGIDR